MSNVKVKEEKKFVQLSPDTVSMLAESIGISGNGISSGVSRALAEDVSYRCRELANICGQLMKHGKRKKLTTEDVERAMKWYDAPPSLGHRHNDLEPTYVQVPDVGRLRDGEAIYAPDEVVVDLRDFSFAQDPPEANVDSPSCEATWLSLEGSTNDDSDPKVAEYTQQGSLSPALLQYYAALTNVVLADTNHDIRKTLLDDLKTNSKVGGLVPLLVSFIGNGMQRHSENQALVKRLLTLIEALFLNPHLNLSPKPYLSHLVTALLSTLITDRPNNRMSSDTNADGCVKILKMDYVQHAGQILKLALDNWATPVNQLRSQTHKALREYLNDPKSSLASQYGTLSAMICLGPEVIKECVLPQMDRYLTSIEAKIDEASTTARQTNGHLGSYHDPADHHQRLEALHLMKSTLLLACRSILSNQKGDKKSFSDIYTMMYKHFGDSLLMTSFKANQGSSSESVQVEAPGRLLVRPLNCRPSPHMTDMDHLLGGPFVNGLQDHGEDMDLDHPLPLSPSVLREFQCAKPLTIRPLRPIRLACGSPLMMTHKKKLEQKHVSSEFKAFQGCVGKRMGQNLLKRRLKKVHSYSLFTSI